MSRDLIDRLFLHMLFMHVTDEHGCMAFSFFFFPFYFSNLRHCRGQGVQKLPMRKATPVVRIYMLIPVATEPLEEL